MTTLMILLGGWFLYVLVRGGTFRTWVYVMIAAVAATFVGCLMLTFHNEQHLWMVGRRAALPDVEICLAAFAAWILCVGAGTLAWFRRGEPGKEFSFL